MDMMLLGWLGALGVGLSLALCGAGGSILAVPILVYLMGVPATDATVYSLFIVGVTAAISAYSYYQKKLIDFPVAVAFIAPSLLSIELVRAWLLPIIPHVLYQSQHWVLHRDTVILLIFSIIMLAAARAMLRPSPSAVHSVAVRPWSKIMGQGLLLGCMVGLVGAGGGFLIVPALVTWVGLSMAESVGTSLLIITINAMFGFAVGIQSGSEVDVALILTFTALSLLGAWIGTRLAYRVNEKTLKIGFAYMIILIAVSMGLHSLWNLQI